MRKKVLILSPFYHPNIGGAESFCLALHDSLSVHYDVEVATIDWGKQKTWKGVNVLKGLSLMLRLRDAAIRKDIKSFDMVYAVGLNAAMVAHMLTKKYCTILLALYDFNNSIMKLSRSALLDSEYIFVEGKGGRKNLSPLCLPNIVEFTHWTKQLTSIIKDNTDELSVLFIGRPIMEKGRHVIEMAEKLIAIARRKVKFIYVANIPYKDCIQFYKMADVLVVPSLYPEGHTRVVIEAASHACAVVASNRGSLPEQVGSFGIVIEPTADNFYQEILNLDDDYQRLCKLQNDAFNYANKNFSEANADIFLIA